MTPPSSWPPRRRGWPSATDANALAKLGMVYASLGDQNPAIPLLQQALTGKLISPTVVRLRLGVLQYRAGQRRGAAGGDLGVDVWGAMSIQLFEWEAI